jgi:cold shock CspA family protein
MSSRGPSWNLDAEKFTGDIGAALHASRDEWERFDAGFTEIDDELGGSAWIAAGSIDTAIGEIEFGVLDYGAETTYLLVPATGDEKRPLRTAIVEALVEAEIISSEKVLDERAPFADEDQDLARRVAALEQLMGETVAEAESTAIPVALDIETPARYPRLSPMTRILRYVPVLNRRRGGRGTWEEAYSHHRHFGTIESLNRDKGIGTIRPEGGGKKVMLKITDFHGREPVDVGKKITFKYGIEYGFELESPDEPEDSPELRIAYSASRAEKS